VTAAQLRRISCADRLQAHWASRGAFRVRCALTGWAGACSIETARLDEYRGADQRLAELGIEQSGGLLTFSEPLGRLLLDLEQCEVVEDGEAISNHYLSNEFNSDLIF
jgi:hypothetical protein